MQNRLFRRATLVALTAVVALSAVAPVGVVDAHSRARAVKPVPRRVVPYRVGRPFTTDTDLVSTSGYAAWMIDEFLARTTRLPALGAAFTKAERAEGINARYLLAHALLESGWGGSDIARLKRNLFGYTAYDRDPWKYATRFASYQKGIALVAAKIRHSYLTPGGRFWYRFPTLRAMNMYYASGLGWADKIAGLANEVDATIVTLRERRLRMTTPALRSAPTTGARLSLDIAWRARRGAVLPKGIRFAVRWVPLSLVESAVAGPTIAPAAAWSMAKRTDRPGHVARLAIRAPKLPGVWRLDVEARDSDGRALPRTDRLPVRSTIVRVAGPREVGIGIAAGRHGDLGVTLANRGRTPVAAVGPSGTATTIEAWALPLDPDQPAVRLAVHPLVAPLARGATSTVRVPAPAVPSVVVARVTGDPAAVGRAIPAAALVTAGPAGRLTVAGLAVGSARDDRLLGRPAAPGRISLLASDATGTVLATVAAGEPAHDPAPEVTAVEGSAGTPWLLVRSLSAEPARDAAPSRTLASLASDASLIEVSGLAAGMRLVVAAIVPPDGGTADVGTLRLAWVPAAAAPGEAINPH